MASYDKYYPESVYEREHQELETVRIFDELCKSLGINSINNPHIFYDEDFKIIGKNFYTETLKKNKDNNEPVFNDYTIDRLKYIISLALDIETNTRDEQYGLLYGIRKIKKKEEELIITEAEHQYTHESYEITRQFLDNIITAISKTTDNVGGILLLSILLQDIEKSQENEDNDLQCFFRTSCACINAFKYFIYLFICKMFEKCKNKNTVPRYQIRDSYLSILTRNYYYDIYTVLQDYMTYNIDNLDFYDLLPKNLPNNNYIDEDGREKVVSSYYHPEDYPRTSKTVYLCDINPIKYKSVPEQFMWEYDDNDGDDDNDDDDEFEYLSFTPDTSIDET